MCTNALHFATLLINTVAQTSSHGTPLKPYSVRVQKRTHILKSRQKVTAMPNAISPKTSEIPLPDTMKHPILEHFKGGEKFTMNDASEFICTHFNLSDEQRTQQSDDGRESLVKKRTSTALSTLRDVEYIRGTDEQNRENKITAKGLAYLLSINKPGNESKHENLKELILEAYKEETQQPLLLPVLRFYEDDKVHNYDELRAFLTERSELTAGDFGQSQLRKHSEEMVRNLRNAICLERVKSGVYRITERGRDLLDEGHERITYDLLTKYPEFGRTFKKDRSQGKKEEDDPPATAVAGKISDSGDPEKCTGGKNVVLYGVPGCGKSYAIRGKISEACKVIGVDANYEQFSKNGQIQRVVFHPDYTYSDFTGQILPKVDSGTVSYNFTPGPFTKILEKATKDQTKKPYFLIIEEINRGNAAAIFGDLFQLLDRDDKGKSEYEIDSHEIGKEVNENHESKIRIPANLWIFATMNTSDQNVFPLDTAFQRRWDMELIRNEFTEAAHEFQIGDTGAQWKAFAEAVNKLLTGGSSLTSEDKRLGAWFIKKTVTRELFANKVLKYLWDDAFKFNRDKLFNTQKSETLEAVIDNFTKENGVMEGIFVGDIDKLFHTTADQANKDENPGTDNTHVQQADNSDET